MGDATIGSVLPSYIQAGALVTTGIWAYFRYFHQRANEPACDIDIDVRFVGKQDGKWIIEITSFLTNRSLVRVEYRDLQVTLRYLRPEDKVEDGGDKLLYQLKFPRTTDELIPRTTDELKPRAKRSFANAEYLNPNQAFKHRYITSIPIEATFLWVQCKLAVMRKPLLKHHEPGEEAQAEKPNEKNSVKVNSQRIFRVPEKEPEYAAAVKP